MICDITKYSSGANPGPVFSEQCHVENPEASHILNVLMREYECLSL